MSSTFVEFPNTATDYLFSNDVNLCDADTAHGEQGVGKWLGAVSSVPVAFADFGSNAIELTLGSGAGKTSISITATGTSGIPVLGSTQYSISLPQYMTNANGSTDPSYELGVREYNAGGSELTRYVVTPLASFAPNAWADLTGTITTQATAAFLTLNAFVSNVRVAGDKNYTGATCVRLGADPTFVPSLDIQGTLFEEKSEAGISATLAAGVLTVGKSWAGDGYYYRRYDGADNSAPLVCEFLAADVLAVL